MTNANVFILSSSRSVNFDRENIDELLEIRQYFPHQNFVPYGSYVQVVLLTSLCVHYHHTAASDVTKKNASSNTTALTCHHHNGTYCPECKKTVCMCTVKDHVMGEVEDDSAYKSKVHMGVKVDDVLASFVIINVVILQVLLCNNHLRTSLAYMNALQSTDSLCMDFYWSGYDGGIKEKIVTKVNNSLMVNILITGFST